MSIASVTYKHSFGLKGDVLSNVHYVDEQIVLYPVGGNIVLYNVDGKAQRFIPTTPGAAGVTSLSLSPNRRYLAIAEKGEKATVTMFDLQSMRKRKVLTHSECQSQEFISLAFSPDSKYLVAQGGYPDWLLVYWTWEKSKVMAVTKATNAQNSPVHQVTFNPQDNTQLCVVGDGIFKLYRYSEGNLKQIATQRSETRNYLCQAWTSEERVVVGDSQGKVFLFESGDVKAEISIVTAKITSRSTSVVSAADNSATAATPAPVRCISSSSKGFLCSSGSGVVHLFEKSDEKDKEHYKKIREVHVPLPSGEVQGGDRENVMVAGGLEIMSMALSPSEDCLVCSTEGQQLYTIMLSSADIGRQGEHAQFDLLSQPFHRSAITGLDICVRKPLVATCSLDKTVCIWNYDKNFLELKKEFTEEAYSIALHPSGLFVLVGFSDKLRLMNLLIDDIRPFKELTIRGCRECAFSNGGHLFAAVHGTVIQLYSTYSFDNVANLKGHNGKVRALVWSIDDSKIISCGQEGAVYEWAVQTCKREGESVLKSCSYTGIALSSDGRTTFAVGSDCTLKEISLSESQVKREIAAGDTVLTQIAMSRSGRMLFAGTTSGALRSLKFPLTEPGEYSEHQVHSAGVTKMRLSADNQHLFSASEDGSLYLFRVQDKETRSVIRDHEVQYAQEILVTKSDLQEKMQVIADLQARVDELRSENEYQLRLRDMNYNEKLKELTEKFVVEMETLKTKHQVLKAEKDKEEAHHSEEMANVISQNGREIQELESTNNQKLMAEYEKYQELQAKSQRQQEDYEKQVLDAEEAKQRKEEELTEYYETVVADKQTEVDEMKKKAVEQEAEHQETMRQIEEDADREILDIKGKYERRLRDERDQNLRLKGETGIMKKKFGTLQKEIEERKAEIQQLHVEETKLQAVIRSLEKDIVGLKKEIQERDETIQDKEKRIYDLKKKNQELEKFKFVLDYKIKELKKQIEPRENDIKAMNEQIQEMEQELERFHKRNLSLDLRNKELMQKLKATDKEMHSERQRVHDVEAVLKRFKTDVHHAAGLIQEPKQLKESVIQLYKKHVGEDTPESVRVDQDIQQEYSRQREHLERSVASLRKKLLKDSEIHRADNVRIMQENVTLIREINDLRRELKLARTQVHDLEVSLKMAQKQAGLAGTLPDRSGRGLAAFEIKEAAETNRIIEIQRSEIRKLRNQVQELELGASRPGSGGRLPPVSAPTQAVTAH